MNRILHTFLCVTLLWCIGCSSGGNFPLTPGNTSNDTLPGGKLGIGVSEYLPDGSPAEGSGFLGIFNVWVNTDRLTGEIAPAREVSLEDVLEVVDITNFLQIAPCTECVKLESIEIDADGNLLLKIGVKHPFAPGNPLQPPTGKNRADLHVFNVEGIIVSDGSGTPAEFTGIGETVGNFVLLNADGYTPYLDSVMEEILPTTATIHPYICHFDDYDEGNFSASYPTGFQSVTTPGPSGNLVMKMGADYDIQDYIFSTTGGGNLEFTLAIGCTYAVSAAGKAQRFSPEYRVPQHNKKAASEVKVEVVSDDLYAGDTSSTADLAIRVLDINHGVAAGTNLDQMFADSSVAQIKVEVPGVTSSPVTVSNPAPISGDGRNPADPLLFEVQITNSAGAGIGTYTGLVKVLDSYPAGSNALALLNGMDGIKRVGPVDDPLTGLFDIPEFATYQIFEVEVIVTAPTCAIETDPDPPTVGQGEIITLDGSASYCPVAITTYEWDLDYDGITFDVDDTGATIDYSECIPDTYTIGLRVTNQNLLSAICTVDVTVIIDAGEVDGWGTDIAILSSPPTYTLNTSFRGIRSFGDNLYVVAYSTTAPSNIYFVKSTDSGNSWGSPVQVTSYTGSATSNSCNLWVDGNTGDIYVAYASNAGIYGTNLDVYCVRSQDEGVTWGTPERINHDPIGSLVRTYPNVCVDDSVNPSRLYYVWQNNGSLNVYSSTTTADNFSTWGADIQIDDTSAQPNQAVVYVNPVDHSVNVVWSDPINYGGSGNVYFDRSTDNATSWGSDVVVFTHTGTFGPYEPNLAINPTTGVPAVMWRDITTTDRRHFFCKATSATGAAWNTPVQIATIAYTGNASWAGSMDVYEDGHWAITFKHTVGTLHKVLFTQSQDDGVTWTTPVQVDDSNNIYNPNLCFDDCKNVHIMWADRRTGNYVIYYDQGT